MSVELQPTVAGRFNEAEGVTPPSSPDGLPGFLSDVIVELGFADAAVVDDAVDQSRQLGKVAEQLLVESGAISDEQLAIAIAERNGLPYVDLFTFKSDQDAARLIDPDTARRYRAVPVAFDIDGALVVALVDPMDALAVSDIGVITKSEVRIAVASDPGVEALLRTLPTSRREARLASSGEPADGPAAEPDEWMLSGSISTVDSSAMGDFEEQTRSAPAPAAVQPQALESRIDELVAAALEKRLTTAPSDDGDEELERTQERLALTHAELQEAREETAQAREQAAQARAEVEALSAQIEQFERELQPAAAPSADELAVREHFGQPSRELDEPGY